MRAGIRPVSISTLSIRSSWICPLDELRRNPDTALFPNVVEAQSGLAFAEFFQNERDTGRKGIVALAIGGAG